MILGSLFANIDPILDELNKIPEFFQESLNWSIQASYKYIAFVAATVLVVQLFKR